MMVREYIKYNATLERPVRETREYNMVNYMDEANSTAEYKNGLQEYKVRQVQG
jgi:hypothetical protein